MNSTPKALITGASSGIGATYADRLARRGYDLVLVARRRDRIEELAENVRSATGRRVEVVAADLNNKAERGRVEEILRTDPDLAMLVNSAGFGVVTPLLELDVDTVESMIDLNVTALVRLTHAVAPAFVQRGKGAIINIGSTVALAREWVKGGAYSGTKAFVSAFTLSIHDELAASGVRVQAVLPGAIATDFWGLAGVSLERFSRDTLMTVDDVVDAALAGFDLGEVMTIPSLPDMAEWEAYEAARKAMIPKLSRRVPAARYGTTGARPAREAKSVAVAAAGVR